MINYMIDSPDGKYLVITATTVEKFGSFWTSEKTNNVERVFWINKKQRNISIKIY